jgi:hypothetical protein
MVDWWCLLAVLLQWMTGLLAKMRTDPTTLGSTCIFRVWTFMVLGDKTSVLFWKDKVVGRVLDSRHSVELVRAHPEMSHEASYRERNWITDITGALSALVL